VALGSIGIYGIGANGVALFARRISNDGSDDGGGGICRYYAAALSAQQHAYV